MPEEVGKRELRHAEGCVVFAKNIHDLSTQYKNIVKFLCKEYDIIHCDNCIKQNNKNYFKTKKSICAECCIKNVTLYKDIKCDTDFKDLRFEQFV